MGCSCQSSVTTEPYDNLSALIAMGFNMTKLEINPELETVPVRNFKSSKGGLMYRVYRTDQKFDVLEQDVNKLLSIQVAGGKRLFVVSQEVEAKNVVVTNNNNVSKDVVVEIEDDFTSIKGIGDKTNIYLHEHSIYTFEDLASVKFEELESLGIKESWVESAKEIVQEMQL